MHFLITGAAGTGKSTIAQVLTARGHKGVDIDAQTDIAGSVNIHTNVRETVPEPRPIDWAPNHKWLWDAEKLHTYLENQMDNVFLCGFAWNQADFYIAFNKVFILTLDDKTLEQRLTTRSNNSFGKYPHELATAIELNHTLTQTALGMGAVPLDASQSPDEIASEIVHIVHEK